MMCLLCHFSTFLGTPASNDSSFRLIVFGDVGIAKRFQFELAQQHRPHNTYRKTTSTMLTTGSRKKRTSNSFRRATEKTRAEIVANNKTSDEYGAQSTHTHTHRIASSSFNFANEDRVCVPGLTFYGCLYAQCVGKMPAAEMNAPSSGEN